MLNLLSTDYKDIHRREFLRFGSLAAGGVSLAEMLRHRAKAQDARKEGEVSIHCARG
jgi:hypothetical protein